MIAKYSNLCFICSVRIPAGEDVHYDGEAKTIAHWACIENPKPGPAEFRLATELGFLEHAEAVRTNWVLFLLSDVGRGRTAGRNESQAHPRSQSNLCGT